MGARALFCEAPPRAAMYESFYLRAVSPSEPLGVWIRHTVHKPPGRPAQGSVWCTVFDAHRGGPFMHKLTSDELHVPTDAWITVGESVIGPEGASGRCGPASWSLRIRAQAGELRHLSPTWLYRTPLPRTKLTSPAPAASFDGVLELDGRAPLQIRGWRGMLGHNWGSEHAARWIWLHGIGFEQVPAAWLDVALARVALAGRLTPWLASGAVHLEGEPLRLGGLRARVRHVHESAAGCTLELSGTNGLRVRADVRIPAHSAAGWRYADPHDPPSSEGQHEVVNCSIARLELQIDAARGIPTRTLVSEHGGAYELGMREHDHDVPLAPFP